MQLKFANSVLTYIICISVFGCYSTSNTNSEIALQTTENNTLTKIFNEDIQKSHQNNTTDLIKIKIKNNLENNRQLKKPRKNKRIRTKNMSNNLPVIGENVHLNATTRRTTKRRRRIKKKRKKQQNINNILEITTARVLPNNTFVVNDTNVHNLIQQLNNNSESTLKLEEIEKKFNESLSLNIKFHAISNQTNTKKRNRCAKNNGGCSQICKLKGKRKCSCFRGYVLTKNGKKCVDIDECKLNNGGCKHTCKNTPGGYYCACPEGFRISDDLKSCQDINECFLRNGHGPCQDTCTNTHGSYTCDCTHLKGTRLSQDKHSCDDIDECEEGSSGCTHLCINTVGGVFCSCPEGMELMSDYKTCQDIDECEDEAVAKSCGDSCVNTIGSYYCERDFQNDQFFKQTKIPVCPPLDPPEHGFITCLRNTSLMYKNGRKILKNIPGTKCHLVCPIGFKLIGSNRLVCGISGQWLIVKKGYCSRAPNPTLECPPDQTFILEDNQDKIFINFSAPRTNVRWQIVKSYPEWAKNLRGELEEGRHNIQFSVTDPATKLSSACSFFITVKK